MNVLSFVLAIVAVVIFLSSFSPNPPGRWASIGLGLAVLTIAWMIQLIWVTEGIRIS